MTKWVDFKKIKSDVSIEKILEHYNLLTALNKKGDNYIGACPIYKGSNPTQFHVSLSKNNFNCFGDCHGGGNVIDFVSKMEGVDIRKVALLIQDWFGIKSKRPGKNKEGSEATENATANEKISKESKEKLENKPLGFALQNLNKEHSYIEHRGLEKATIEYFGIGHCKKGVMKSRIAIPIHNVKGELVAYTGRWIGDPPDKETPKYKLPVGFYKSLEVFNLHRVKDEMGDSGLILVEGLFDCMKVWQAGYKNVAALFGSSLSEEHEKLIVNTVGSQGKVFLMFDEDEAGWACRNDVLERLSKKVFVKVIELGKDGMQPDKLSSEEIKKLLG